MIYIRPLGGLGNFLFHISAIWTLAKDNNDELCLLDIDNKILTMQTGEVWNAPHAADYMYLFNRFPMKNEFSAPVIHSPYVYVPLQYIPEREYYGYYQSEKNSWRFDDRKDTFLKHSKEKRLRPVLDQESI